MKEQKREVPTAMIVQLSRLFGEKSKIAKKNTRSDTEWRRDLNLVLAELWNYFDSNVETDTVHRVMLHSGFAAATHALSIEENFWPGYVEGITRILLCLLGDYPDHRKRKTGSKKEDHYRLSNDRSVGFLQTNKQKLHMLCWAAPALLELSAMPLNVFHDFRNDVGFEVPQEEFLSWYKENYPDDYLKVF
jgi:hypothetical protein